MFIVPKFPFGIKEPLISLFGIWIYVKSFKGIGVDDGVGVGVDDGVGVGVDDGVGVGVGVIVVVVVVVVV